MGGAAKEKKPPPPPSTVGDIEDLASKHPGLTSARERAPRARASLLEWYDANHRVLPWRRNARSTHAPPPDPPSEESLASTGSALERARAHWRGVAETGASAGVPPEQYAYGVWVSEIMSQQTQIDRVATYWLRWTERWPTAAHLAEATQEEVNELWAGLGYYRRARFLLDGARWVVAEDGGGGKMPSDAASLGKIPGVGPYTASAVASIAFDEPIAAVDGNVLRVVSRLACVRGGGDVTKPGTSAGKACKAVADALLCAERPGDHNQAMMELGATVCTPRNPKCGECPVASMCASRALELEEEANVITAGKEPFRVTDLPEKDKKADKREETVSVRVVRGTRGDTETGADGASKKSAAFFLLVKRPEGGLLSGLWEFPSVVMEDTDAGEDALRAAADRLLAETLRFPAAASSSSPKTKTKTKPLGEIVHVFSHVRQTMKVELVSVELSPTDDGFFGNINARSGDVSSATPEWKWVAEDDMADAGLTSGVRKVYDLVVGKKNGKCGKSKAKQAPAGTPGDSAIARMFAKKAKTETVAE